MFYLSMSTQHPDAPQFTAETLQQLADSVTVSYSRFNLMRYKDRLMFNLALIVRPGFSVQSSNPPYDPTSRECC